MRPAERMKNASGWCQARRGPRPIAEPIGKGRNAAWRRAEAFFGKVFRERDTSAAALDADSPRARFIAGARALAPALVAMLPFGVVVGVASAAAGLTFVEGMALSLLAFSGIVQLVAVQLHVSGAPYLIVVLTAVVVSLRLMMYSASLAPHLPPMSWREKALTGYLLTDHGYALGMIDVAHHPERPNRHWYLIGVGALTWLAWNASVAGGMAIGTQLPPEWGLDFAVPLSFLALLVPLLRDRPSWAAALAGGGVAIAAHAMPLRLGLITAVVAGLAAAVLVRRLGRR
jgi:4-azaleucine resistance transporter AzlC